MSNAKNIAKFQGDLKKIAENSYMDLNQVVRWVALELWNRITARTPVDTGRARASWNLGVGSPDTSVADEQGKSTGAHKTKSSAPSSPKSKFPSLGSKDVSSKPLYITNNLPYIKYLEAGASKQAAGGMLRISVAEVEAEIDNAVKQL